MSEELSTPVAGAPEAVALDGLCKSYDGRRVLDGLSLSVRRGEFLALLGPSGSGKTTAMRLIGGFEAPDAGRVHIAGRDVTDLPPEARPVNTVFQSYALFPHMTVLENVAFGPRMRGLSRAARRARAGEMLELVHLSAAADQPPAELSGGMQQRVALARALANRPEVLLLDEPLAALDRGLRDEMQRELRRIQREIGATFLYVTHDQDEAFGMADRMAVMRAGRFEQVDTPGAIYDRPASGWVAHFVGTATGFAARLAAGGMLETGFGRFPAGFVAPGLAPGDVVAVTLRPEATRFGPVPDPATGLGGIPARLTDRVAIGPNLRLRAVVTPADGATIGFETLVPRAGVPEEMAPGRAVSITFAPGALRAYRPDT